MGKLLNFNKIKWKPFEIREGNIAVRNFYVDYNGKKKPVQSHLDIPKYSFFEILKWEHNPYYGKLDEYLSNGYQISFGGEFVRSENGFHSISISFFTKSPEISYMLAHWENMDHDEKSPDLKFVGSRPFELSEEEQLIFMNLAKKGQLHIEAVLNKFNDNEDIYI